MKKIAIALTVLVLAAFFSCQKSAYVHQFDKNEIQISISSRGGWCAGADSLTMAAKKTIYVHKKTCKDEFKTENLQTSSVEWGELISLLNTDDFESVNLNSCGVCYDGTDFTVTVKQGNFEHAIRFDKLNDPKLATIKPFIDKLMALRNQYKRQFEK